MTGIRIAIAQPEVTNDARKNGALVRKLMRQAAAGKARLVQFPEGLLSGYPKEQLADWSEVDWRLGCRVGLLGGLRRSHLYVDLRETRGAL